MTDVLNYIQRLVREVIIQVKIITNRFLRYFHWGEDSHRVELIQLLLSSSLLNRMAL